MNLHTLLARLIDLRKVDVQVLAEYKRQLANFNGRSKRWQESATPISEDVTR